MKKILFTVLLSIVSQVMMAQARRISGTVTDADGPVMMANVVERDANNRIVSATQTDFNGNFAMQIKSPKNKLVVSYVGDKTKVIPIGNTPTFKIHLESENTTVKEVVVRSKRSSSGGLMIPKREVSVSQQTFSMENVEGLAFTSADEALQGEIAGLDIVSNSGNLGAGTTMRLRGVTTINGNANPLIVVDDKIFDNPDEDFDFANANEEQYASLLSVNVEDIASITVLKDAAATAVWGANGSNGVIQITTKRGARGKTRVNLQYKFTGTWQPKGYNLLNGDDYTMMMKEEFYNPAQRSDATSGIKELNYDATWGDYQNWNNNTDWVKEVTQFGAMHSINANLTGGGQKATFRISAGYDKQTGSIIKQKLDRVSTRLVLDYNVSDRIRFSTNFALTYTNNYQNYEGTINGVKHPSLLSIAQRQAPNMAVYQQDGNGNETDQFYIPGANTSSRLDAVRTLGNPVAIANLAWKKDQTYRITPDFTLKYELLGIGEEKHRLTFNGRVDFDIYARSNPTFYPAQLTSGTIGGSEYNLSTSSESNRFKIGARTELVFTPYFKNKDLSAMALVRYELSTSKSNSQYLGMNMLPDGITSPTVSADLQGMSSGSSRSNSQNFLLNAHLSYKGRYNLGVSVRADGNSRFGPDNKWAYFPGVSLRYNIIDEPFMKPVRKVASMIGLRASWGIVGKAPDADYLFYNTYRPSSGYYGNNGQLEPTTWLDGLKLDDLRWEKTTSYNLGFNLGFLNDMIEVDFDYYYKKTQDLLMSGVSVPSMMGVLTTISNKVQVGKVTNANVGTMENNGWEMNINAKKFVKIGKFSISAGANIAQNFNKIKEMEKRVLDAINNTWDATARGTYLNRIQVGNALGSIYGFRYKGVYQYSYDYLTNYRLEHPMSDKQYEDWINNEFLASGKTAPIVTDANNRVLMGSTGQPKRMAYDYNDGSARYEFQGGDAMYEDVNHDGQINAMDVVYLGNSLPKVNGGFNFTFQYGNFSIKTRFMYRFGNKIVNMARMELEKMYTTNNQSTTVNYRWRKDGDVTMMPRAMYGTAYNWLGSDRYVENGSFVRFQNLQISYNFPKKMIKNWGLNNLQVYGSVNNIYCWTKYSGVDPEISTGAWGRAEDNSQTPRSRQFTVTLNVGF